MQSDIDMNSLILRLLNGQMLFVLWSLVFFEFIFFGHKLKLYGLYIISGGALPFVVFYLWTAMGWWTSFEVAIVYSRLSHLSLTFSISMSVFMMYRNIRKIYE